MTSLLESISFPQYLRVLHLQLYRCRASKDVLKDIETGHIPLTTLALTTEWSDILQTSLEIPTLISLFITISEFVESNWNKYSCHFHWSFPNLRNFSWTEKPDGCHRPYDVHPLFLDILKTHFNSIVSLQTSLIPREVANEESSLCWTKMPKLQSLVAGFHQLEEIKSKSNNISHSNGTSNSKSLRYLVAVGTFGVNPHQVVDGLKTAIYLCNELQTIYILGTYAQLIRDKSRGIFRSPRTYNFWDTGANQRLEKICQKRSIQVKYVIDVPL
jgi:hypothetical protein